VGAGDAVVPADAGQLVGPPNLSEARFEIVEVLLRYLDDVRVHGERRGVRLVDVSTMPTARTVVEGRERQPADLMRQLAPDPSDATHGEAPGCPNSRPVGRSGPRSCPAARAEWPAPFGLHRSARARWFPHRRDDVARCVR